MTWDTGPTSDAAKINQLRKFCGKKNHFKSTRKRMWNKVGLKGGKHGDWLPGRKPSSKLQPESGICWLALRLGATGCKWGDSKQGCLLGSPFSLHTARMISSKLASCHLLQLLQNSLRGFSFFFLMLTKQTITEMWQQSQKPEFSPSSPHSWPVPQPPTGPGASEFPRFVPTHRDRTMSSSDMPHLRVRMV